MKNFFRFLVFCITIATLVTLACIKVNGQTPTAPTYTGTLDNSVFFPVVFKGKNYKVTGNRVGSSAPYYGDTISDKNAVITHTGTGLFTQTVGKNGYGFLTFTNNTGSALAAALFVNVAYSDTSAHLPIPVVNNYAASDDITTNHIVTVNAFPYGFNFILKAQVPNGESIVLTYNVKGF